MAEIPIQKKSGIPPWVWILLLLLLAGLVWFLLAAGDDEVDEPNEGADRVEVSESIETFSTKLAAGNFITKVDTRTFTA